MTDIQRDRLLRAALGFLALEPRAPELRLLHRWADSWRGVGRVALSHAYITLFTTTGHSLSLEPGGSAFSASRRSARTHWRRAIARMGCRRRTASLTRVPLRNRAGHSR